MTFREAILSIVVEQIGFLFACNTLFTCICCFHKCFKRNSIERNTIEIENKNGFPNENVHHM